MELRSSGQIAAVLLPLPAYRNVFHHRRNSLLGAVMLRVLPKHLASMRAPLIIVGGAAADARSFASTLRTTNGGADSGCTVDEKRCGVPGEGAIRDGSRAKY